MEIAVVKGDILNTSAELIVVGLYMEENWENDFVLSLNECVGGKLKKKAQATDFNGKLGESLFFAAGPETSSDYVLVVGLGAQNELNASSIRQITGSVFSTASRLRVKTVALELLGEDNDEVDAKINGRAIAEALLLARYEFNAYKETKKTIQVNAVTIVAEDGRDARKAERGVEEAVTVIDGVTVARDLVNTPAQDMNPERLAESAEQIAKLSNGRVKTRVYDREWCAKKKMGSFLAVAQGADTDPKFIHLIYKPTGKPKGKVALVGKGVTFDSGGLSLKPGKSMETMKCDMAGAAAVLGVFATLARTTPRVEVHGIIPATENMINGKAIRPGDVVRAMNGKTIEILNTDAEGRLILADALGYAAKLDPDYTIDLATLTGACVVALGEEISSLTANDDEFAQSLLAASSTAGEEMWQMPLYAPYRKLLESDIADVRNISTSRYGGSMTAALFLNEFVEDGMVWAHMDIAGPAFAERPIGSFLGKGGTGYGVRTLTAWLATL
ncbi:leucyl aminopeptidase [Candidatus Uhrbacteria bacterium]|jgi:leucyl aminopeptidase|nr:leucyl aminopeptidase [Candidatus Uhrbacteria bacterium]